MALNLLRYIYLTIFLTLLRTNAHYGGHGWCWLKLIGPELKIILNRLLCVSEGVVGRIPVVEGIVAGITNSCTMSRWCQFSWKINRKKYSREEKLDRMSRPKKKCLANGDLPVNKSFFAHICIHLRHPIVSRINLNVVFCSWMSLGFSIESSSAKKNIWKKRKKRSDSKNAYVVTKSVMCTTCYGRDLKHFENELHCFFWRFHIHIFECTKTIHWILLVSSIDPSTSCELYALFTQENMNKTNHNLISILAAISIIILYFSHIYLNSWIRRIEHWEHMYWMKISFAEKQRSVLFYCYFFRLELHYCCNGKWHIWHSFEKI